MTSTVKLVLRSVGHVTVMCYTFSSLICIFELQHQKKYLLTYAPTPHTPVKIQISLQLAHLCSQIRIFTGCILDSQGCQLSLMLRFLCEIFSRRYFEIFFLFSQKTGFDISCKLFPLVTICMNCQILFCGNNKKNIVNLSSAGLA